MYCVELPKYTRHLLLVRREGRVHWSGNSHPDHVDGIRGRTLQLPVLASRKVISQLRKICELRDPRPGSRFEYKDVSLKLIPCLHSVKAPMWGLVLNEEIGIFTDIIAPRRGWDVLKNLKVYIGDGSTLNRPIIRRDKETGEIYGHTTMLTQLRKADSYGWKKVIFTHFGKVPVEMGDEKLQEALGQDVLIARDNLTLTL